MSYNNNNNNSSNYHYNFDINSEYFDEYRDTQQFPNNTIVPTQNSSQSTYDNTNHFPIFSTQTPTNYHGQHHVDDDVDENVVENFSTPTSRNRCNFSVKEDEALISSFISISEDGIVGTNQNKNVFWKRVFEKYELARASNPALQHRSIGMLDNRFRRLSTIIMKWGSCYEMAGRRRASGWNEESVLAETRVLYKTRFNLDHAWEMLKNHPKWRGLLGPFAANAFKAGYVGGTSTGALNEDSTSSGKRARLDEDERSNHTSNDIESASTQRPEGRQQAKRNKGKKKVNNVELDEINLQFAAMNETATSDIALEREKLQLKKKNAEVALQQLMVSDKREERKRKEEERKRKEQEIEQQKNDWQMLQQLMQAQSLPPQLETLKINLLNKFGGL